MPYKDEEDKKRWAKKWHEKSKKNGYNKWLHGRRKVRFDDATEFRAALESIGLGKTGEDAQAIALDTLLASKKRWEDLGEPPHRRRKDLKLDGLHGPEMPKNNGEKHEPKSLLEALAKVGLS